VFVRLSFRKMGKIFPHTYPFKENTVATSSTTTTTEYNVQKLYVEYFSRPADNGGLSYWTGILNQYPDGIQVASRDFSNSAEYKQTYAGMDNAAVVNTVYQHIFGRSAEGNGVGNYWTNLLDKKVITIDNVVTQIAAGAQGSDKDAFNGKVAAAVTFTQHLDTSAEQHAYATTAGVKVGADFVAGVKDLMSGAAAQDANHVDAIIATIPGATGTGFAEVVAAHQPHVDAALFHG
jgi:hypothetical protein